MPCYTCGKRALFLCRACRKGTDPKLQKTLTQQFRNRTRVVIAYPEMETMQNAALIMLSIGFVPAGAILKTPTGQEFYQWWEKPQPKFCRACQQEKPGEDFYSYSPMCKACHIERSKKRYKNLKESARRM